MGSFPLHPSASELAALYTPSVLTFLQPSSLLPPRIRLYICGSAQQNHPARKKLCPSLRQRPCWPSMSINCYAGTRACLECAKFCTRMWKHSSELGMFPASQPPAFVSRHSGRINTSLTWQHISPGTLRSFLSAGPHCTAAQHSRCDYCPSVFIGLDVRLRDSSGANFRQ